MEQTRIEPCPKCSGNRAYADPNGPGGRRLIQINTKGFNKSSPVAAIFCRDCGYIEFYVQQPQKLSLDS